MLYLVSGACLAYRAGLPLLRRRKLRQVAWDFEIAAGNHFKERITFGGRIGRVACRGSAGC